MTYHDNPGGPSGIYACERNVCADEVEIAPGFGANMLAYLRRKQAPQPKQRVHLKLTPDKPHTTKLLVPITVKCPDCPASFVLEWARQVRCPACQQAQTRARKRSEAQRHRDKQPPKPERTELLLTICKGCGLEFAATYTVGRGLPRKYCTEKCQMRMHNKKRGRNAISNTS